MYQDVVNKYKYYALVQRDGGGDIWLGVDTDKENLEFQRDYEYDQNEDYAIYEISFSDYVIGMMDLGYDYAWILKNLFM